MHGREAYPGTPFGEVTVVAGARAGKDSRIAARVAVYEALLGLGTSGASPGGSAGVIRSSTQHEGHQGRVRVYQGLPHALATTSAGSWRSPWRQRSRSRTG